MITTDQRILRYLPKSKPHIYLYKGYWRISPAEQYNPLNPNYRKALDFVIAENRKKDKR